MWLKPFKIIYNFLAPSYFWRGITDNPDWSSLSIIVNMLTWLVIVLYLYSAIVYVFGQEELMFP